MEDRGWDTAPTAGGVYELLRDMSEIVPGVLELDIEELEAGLRPATPDNLPAIGRGTLDGLAVGGGPPPQRDPAHARHRRARGGRAGRRAAAGLGRGRRSAPVRPHRGARMRVLLNGAETELSAGATVETALETLDLPGAGRGVAVAVDAEVVPRGQWGAHESEGRRARGGPARDPGRLR